MRIVPAFVLVVLVFCACIVPVGAQSGHASANQLLAEARTAQQANDLATAARDYRSAVEMQPKNVEARVGLGAVLTRQAHYDDALTQLQAALPLSSSKHRASVLTAIGMAYTKKGDLEAARGPLQEALTLQPANPVAARLLAEADLRQNDAEGALAVLTPRAGAAALDPEFGRVFGMALTRSGKVSDGAQALEHSAEATGDADTFRLAGIAYLDSGEYDSARRELETARRIEPGMAGIDRLVGIARERCGDHYAAEALFRDTLKAEPENFEANLFLGALLLKRHDLGPAATYLNHALTLGPNDAVALYEVAMLQKANHQAAEAAKGFRHAALADPGWAEPHVEIAILDESQRQLNDAKLERNLAETLTEAQLHAGLMVPQLP